jgi:outer membrane lipoprotein SlyB
MKKILAILMCLVVLTFAAIPAGAQTRYRRQSQRISTSQRFDRFDQRSVWDKHRDKITTAGGAVGGAILGGLIGGKKGAIIGAITGGGGAAVYTYKVRNKDRRY